MDSELIFVKPKYKFFFSFYFSQIQTDVLKAYASSAGFFPLFWLGVAFLIYVASQVATSLWLGAWSDDPILNGTEAKQQSDYRITFYGVFGVVQGEFENFNRRLETWK